MKDFPLYDIAAVYGRFNLLHNGHLQLFLKMADKAKVVVIGLSSAEGNLPVSLRMKAIGKACEAAGVNYRIVPASQPFELFEEISKQEDAQVLTMFGEDQYKLGKAAQRVYGWDTDVIPRLTSSTAIRGLIDNEDWDVLERLVPPSIINDVINLRKLETN